MTTPEDPELTRGRAAYDLGRYSETIEILRPLADAGNIKAQALLGNMLVAGVYRAPDRGSVCESPDATSPQPPEEYDANQCQADQELARTWLKPASDAGDAQASYDLAMTFLTDVGETGWEERKKRVLELFARACEQGFPYFGDEDPPGESHLQFLERDADLCRRYKARHPEET